MLEKFSLPFVNTSDHTHEQSLIHLWDFLNMNLVYNAHRFQQALLNPFALMNATVKYICTFTLHVHCARISKKI